MTDRQNVAQFKEMMCRAYAKQKKAGVVQGEEAQKLDKLFALDQNDRCVDRAGRILFFWRTFRRRVAIKYASQKGIPVRFQLDWETIFQWVLDNWELIIRTIIFLVPFLV